MRLDGEALLGEELGEEDARVALMVGGGLDVDEPARQVDGVDGHESTG
jgi:hypothetical protein